MNYEDALQQAGLPTPEDQYQADVWALAGDLHAEFCREVDYHISDSAIDQSWDATCEEWLVEAKSQLAQ